jgi:predicted nucleotidyltransferase
MSLALPIDISQEAIAEFCHRWQITELAFFGSILRPDFRTDSDVDVLVTFAPNATWGLWDLSRMEDELADIFRHRVDLVSRRGVENSRNPIRRHEILATAQTFYAAAG